jgi:hypothetical protein
MEDKMACTCSERVEMKKTYTILVGKPEEETTRKT